MTILESNEKWMESQAALQARWEVTDKSNIKVNEARRKDLPPLIKKGIKEFQSGGKSIRRIEEDLNLPTNSLFKRVKFLASFFFNFHEYGKDPKEKGRNINYALQEAHLKIGTKTANKLIKSAEPFAEAYINLYDENGEVPSSSSFPRPQESATPPSEVKNLVSQFVPTHSFLNSTPTYWDWPAPPETSQQTAAPVTEASSQTKPSSRKRKTHRFKKQFLQQKKENAINFLI